MATRLPPRNKAVALSAAASALAIGCWLIKDGTRSAYPPQPGRAETFQGPGHPPLHQPAAPDAHFTSRAAPLTSSAPIRIRIRSIGVDAPLKPLGLDTSGRLQAPPVDDKNLAGWYEHGPTPGSRGNALIDGHVDNSSGPAVFYNLGALRKGAAIQIQRHDGTTADFAVDAIEVYQKKDFPDSKVYAPTSEPQLRVITCGGGYTKQTGYLGNIVVYAHLRTHTERGRTTP